MGTKMGPSYANLFVGYIEHNFFSQYNGPKPELYRRYIDDCVGATCSTREELDQFITTTTTTLFISPHNIQEMKKIYNSSTDNDRGAGCPK